jgi:hypothetical protein
MSLNPAPTKDAATAFISYAHEDKEFVRRLCESLKEQGVEPVGDWLLTPGEHYEERLRKLNLTSQAFVFVITPDSIGSQACRNELALAVDNKKRVLPVSRRGHGDDNLLDPALRAPHWTFLRDGDDYEAGVRQLVKAINTDFALMNTHGRLLLAAEEWKDNGRNRGYLLRKDGLKEAEVWLAMTSAQSSKLPQPTPLQAEFIRAGQSARSRGARVAFGVVLAVVLSLAGLSLVALAQRSTAVSNAERAERNAEEAKTQARIAGENEARALANEREARRQEKLAQDNLAEAKRQQALAEANERKAVRNAEEARRQQLAAEANAARALEIGKRRLVVATLMLNPEGTNFTTLLSLYNLDLQFGIRPWSLRNGSLKTILQKFQAREPELFTRIFGDGDAALARRLLDAATPGRYARPLERNNFLWRGTPRAVAAKGVREEGEPAEVEEEEDEPEDEPAQGEQKEDGDATEGAQSAEVGATERKPEGEPTEGGQAKAVPAEEDDSPDDELMKDATRLPDTRPKFPDGYLNREPWVTRFKLASQEPAFQAIQYEEHTADYLSFVGELRRFAPQVKTERGVAFMLDLAYQMGLTNAKNFVAKVQKEGSSRTEAELLRRVADLSVRRAPPNLRPSVKRRREMFLSTPYFSDKVLGF